MRGVNDDEIGALAALARDAPLTVRFIELMPFAGNAWSAARFLPLADALATLRAAHPDLHHVGAGDVHAPDAQHLYTAPGWRGRVGFIASMTDSFCGTCNRLRLTADGNVRACLHGDAEWPLRDALRRGDSAAVTAAITAAVAGKHAALGGKGDMFALARSAAAGGTGAAGVAAAGTDNVGGGCGGEVTRRRPMIAIGG